MSKDLRILMCADKNSFNSVRTSLKEFNPEYTLTIDWRLPDKDVSDQFIIRKILLISNDCLVAETAKETLVIVPAYKVK